MTDPDGLPRFSGAVLTGGESRRMGTDKALLAVEGRPLAAAAHDALACAGAAEVLAIGGDLDSLVALGFDARPDPRQGTGPLGGLVSALEEAAEAVVVVLACDLPDASPGPVRSVVAALGDHDVAAPVAGGRTQLLHAAYRRSVRPVLDERHRSGERAVWRAVEGLRVVEVPAGDEAALRDLDRPDDLWRR